MKKNSDNRSYEFLFCIGIYYQIINNNKKLINKQIVYKYINNIINNMNNTKDILIIDIITPFLTNKYDRIKDNIIESYKDLYISDFKDNKYYQIKYVFTELMIESVKPVNKILTSIFVKNNSQEIINKIYEYIKN